jgi:hypothetical protein
VESLCKCTLAVLEVCVWYYGYLHNCVLLSQDSSEEKQNVHDTCTKLHTIHDNSIGGKSIATQPCIGHSHSGAYMPISIELAVVLS